MFARSCKRGVKLSGLHKLAKLRVVMHGRVYRLASAKLPLLLQLLQAADDDDDDDDDDRFSDVSKTKITTIVSFRYIYISLGNAATELKNNS